MKKIALAVITRNTKEDVKILDRLLDNVSPYIDGIFITNTTKDGDGGVEKIAKKYNAILSYFKWVDDFAAARNFNFSQVSEDFEYIMWSDVDDMWRGLEDLQKTLESDADGYAFWYLYHFDENKQPTISHKKTMIVRNDGSFVWKGKIHEDMDPNRDVKIEFIEGIERMHFTNEERVEEAKERNERIAALAYEENKEDPRNSFNYGNALISTGKYKEAADIFESFIKESGSDDEKYLVRQRLAGIYAALDRKEDAENQLLIAIGLKPTWPDAFFALGQYLFDENQLERAEFYMLQGLVRNPSYHSMIVFNPRDYDYNPMHLLAKIYFRMSRPDKALPLLKGCLKILPEDKQTQNLVAEMEKETKFLEEITTLIEDLKKEEDPDIVKTVIESLPVEKRSHPGISQLYNSLFFKKESSGKDVVFYCGYTTHEWNPILFKQKGFGGSEEAIVHLSKAFAKEGYNVEVYANIGTERIIEDGVTWKPFWEFNPRDSVDHLILWRSPKMCDYEINAKNIYIDLHDVVKEGEFTKKRLGKIKKIFVKTKFHRSLFPSIPDDKFVIIPNGINTSDFVEIKKDPMLIINTSSPDRSMVATTEVFKRVKKLVPQAKLFWAYGWEIFDNTFASDKKMMEWKEELIKKMEEAGVTQLGKIPQHEIANLYEKASIMLYPTEFAEIDCISVKKAQLAGTYVISTDFGALDESVKTGFKVHSKKNKDNWAKPYQISFGVEEEEQIESFVSETVRALTEGIKNQNKMREFGRSFDWSNISEKWIKNLN